MQPVPGIQIVGTTQRDVGRKNRVGRRKKGDRMKKLLSPSPSNLPYFFLSLRFLFRATFQPRPQDFKTNALGM